MKDSKWCVHDYFGKIQLSELICKVDANDLISIMLVHIVYSIRVKALVDWFNVNHFQSLFLVIDCVPFFVWINKGFLL